MVFLFSITSTLPLEVLKIAQEELLDYHGCGLIRADIAHNTRSDSLGKHGDRGNSGAGPFI